MKSVYDIRISDWGSNVSTSDLVIVRVRAPALADRDQIRIARLDAPGAAERDAVVQLQVETGDIVGIRPGRRTENESGGAGDEAFLDYGFHLEIGRASCRERLCQYV